MKPRKKKRFSGEEHYVYNDGYNQALKDWKKHLPSEKEIEKIIGHDSLSGVWLTGYFSQVNETSIKKSI